MPVETPPPAPQLPQIPQWVVTLVTILAGSIKSPFFHTLLTALLSSYGTLYLAKQALPNLPHIGPNGILPKIFPRPHKAEDAILKLTMGNVGCTGTIIGPLKATDAKIHILTAAHCIKVGATGKATLKDGRVLAFKCVSRDAASDAAWLVADHPGGEFPNLPLADRIPDDGEIVWHQGYGIDRPGNRESGTYRGMAANGQQCRFRLSVSPGDSGGGIILDAQSRVISPVCCTTKLSATGDVFGAAPEKAAMIRPKHVVYEEEPPLIYPVLPLPDELSYWQPAVMPPPGGWSRLPN